MTPEEMHAAAAKLRAHLSATECGEVVLFTRAARMLDRLATDPTRDPVDALTSPPQRMRIHIDAEGKVTSVEKLAPKDGTATVERIDPSSRASGDALTQTVTLTDAAAACTFEKPSTG